MLRRTISWYGREYPIVIPLPTKENRETYQKQYIIFLLILVFYIYLFFDKYNTQNVY